MKFKAWTIFLLVNVVLIVGTVAAPVSARNPDNTGTPAATQMVGMQMDGGGQLPDSLMPQLDAIRAATARYRDLDTAKKDGYDKFLTCFKHGDNLGMGQHFVNGTLAGDDTVDPMKPEALVYEPQADGSMVLVAFEYLVFDSAWDPQHTGRSAPTLFGQPFTLMTNIPQTPPVWGLHLWLYSYNPEGLFASFNPTVSCPVSMPSIDMSKM